MQGINIAGISGCYTPGTKYKDETFQANFYLMQGNIPPQELLKALNTETDLEALYGSSVVKKFTSLNFQTVFDFGTQERHYKKTPVDALDFVNGLDGEIGWAVISFVAEQGVSQGGLLYLDTEEIGTWDAHNASITVKDTTCVKDQDNVLKDINFTIRDKSTYEINPLGITV